MFLRHGLSALLLGLFSSLSQAAIFGDSDHSNGVEDQRRTRFQLQEWPREFYAVGRLSCQGQLKGGAILLDVFHHGEEPYPVIVTAKHLLDGLDETDCQFSPGWDPLRRVSIRALVSQGQAPGQAPVNAMAAKYHADWAVLQLFPWPGWSRYAVRPYSMSESKSSRDAYMVAVNQATNTLVVHAHCQFGPADESTLLQGYKQLYWDNCDSMPGSSGGGLFVKGEDGFRLVGLRTGSLFNETVLGGAPQAGSRFEIHSNINVARAIFGEMFDPVCIFADMGCEPVGNTDTSGEN